MVEFGKSEVTGTLSENFLGDRGEGRNFAVLGESTGLSVVGLLDFKDGDLAGVAGLGLGVWYSVDSGLESVVFIKISAALAFLVGDNGLGVSNLGSPLLLLFGESWRNCDRLFKSSLFGDDGCDETAFSMSAFGVDGMLDECLKLFKESVVISDGVEVF